MAIRSSQFFIYDGVKSTDFGIYNVNISSGMLDEPFLAGRHINEVKIRGRDKPYFSGVTHDPLQFTLSFAFDDAFNDDRIRAVARWLSVEYYKPLQFSDNLDRVYYAMIDSDSHLIHNALSQGYITLNFRCNGPYSFSPYIESPVYDLSSNTTNGTTIQFLNNGDVNVRPEMWINKIGAGEGEIINLSNGGISTKFSYIATDPTTAPVLSVVANVSSTLPAATYYGRYTWSTANGETLVSPEISLAVASGNNLVVTIPTLPSGVILGNIYIGTTAGTGTKQGTTTATTFTQSAALVSGSVAPTSNTTGLWNNETVFVNNENEFIQSDQTGVYRYANFSNQFLECVFGTNNLLIKGRCTLRFRFQHIYLQG